ncbi:MAG: hypothetical protein L0Y74_06590, partial [candidate division Zixibacteria bacterium]|nr:hypothetical protein [candidate division Zixibacteria bacterium]
MMDGIRKTKASPARYLICLALLVLIGGCQGSHITGSDSKPRTFRMGFSGFPPRADINVAIAAIDMWSQRADAAIISIELPWDS